MSPDNAPEHLIPLMQVPRLSWLPRRRNGKRLHVSTVFRWAQRGLHGVRLPVTQCGGTKCTTEADLRQFFAQLSAGGGDAPQVRTSAQRRRAMDRANRELEAAGI